MSNVLVVGGTGVVGSKISKKLLKSGHDVFLLIRNTPHSVAKTHELKALGASIIFGDLLEPDSLLDIAHGMRYIVATAAAMDTSFTAGYTALLESARKARIQQFLYLSNKPRIMPLLSMFQGKHSIEQKIRVSNVPYTIVQAEPFLGFVVEGMIKQSLELGYPFGYFSKDVETSLQGSHYWIWEDDVANITTAMLGNPLAFNQTYHIGGTDKLTLSQLVNWYERLNNVDIPSVVMPEAPEGVPGFVYDIVSQLFDYDSDIPDDISDFDVSLTSTETVLQQ